MKQTPKPRRWNRLLQNPPEKGQTVILWHTSGQSDYVELVTRDYQGHYQDCNGVYYVPDKYMRWMSYKRPRVQ
jgi:hypothetical protein